MPDLIFEVLDGVATISINRPHARNALALQTMAELDASISSLADEVRVLVIRGAGEMAFCSGGGTTRRARRQGTQPPRAVPRDAVAGIKRLVNAIHPHHDPQLAAATIEAFLRTWADPAHWEAVAEMERRRRQQS